MGSGHVVIRLREDLENRSLCPLVLLYSFALLHEVFCDMDAAMRYCHEPICSNMLELKLKTSMKEVPILRCHQQRNYPCEKDVAPDHRAWTYSACHKQLISLGFRMGYEKPATAYAIRRQCANLISCKCDDSWVICFQD